MAGDNQRLRSALLVSVLELGARAPTTCRGAPSALLGARAPTTRRGASSALVELAARVLGAAALVGCDSAPDDAREGQIVAVLAAADDSFIRNRPALSAGKYTRMAYGLYDFYRGTVPLFRSDMRSGTTRLAVSDFDLDVPLVESLGDPHPENFGVLRSPDGSLTLEPNDFDAADRAPYLWDVRRLAAGMALAARNGNPNDPAAREAATSAQAEIVEAAVESYARAIAALARGQATEEPPGGPIVADVFRRSERDHESRAELEELTVLSDGARRLRRGGLDPEDPESAFADLPPFALAALPAALDRYRATLVRPVPAENLRVLDAVREFGSGIASWPRVRAIVLVRGPSDEPDDDELLEVKELTDSGIAGFVPPGVYHDDLGMRVVIRARAAWSRPDAEPAWGHTTWLGFACQVRRESEGQKGIRVSRMEKELGAPEALVALGARLGWIVARVHGGADRRSHAEAIATRSGEGPRRAAFVEEQINVGLGYADLIEADHHRFVRALHTRGLRLGIPLEPADRPSPDQLLLFGSPPAARPLPPIDARPAGLAVKRAAER